ncbi:hypothetical protein HNP46_006855 [Pseudomonas nitritireducens]|uniref:Uncharacterized protein n=1 Tax=Pseudomonas nitroreducens TaxID=46680 RepID=A0A7W7P4R0_PSENT|nr:hypothetical protein [Pseudomonas nitritireducens]MBB4867936.1 hypothetical protein [Pseudomonas nitritireducens]
MRSLSALLAGLTLSAVLCGHAAGAEPPASPTSPLLEDIERYLLLYSATGDERFLNRLNGLGTQFEQKLGEQKQAEPLRDIWQLYQQTLDRVQAAYREKGVDLKKALNQSQEVADLFDSFLVSSPPPAGLASDLRELALLEARKANHALLGIEAAANQQRIEQLRSAITAQLDALPEEAQRERLLTHWNYLRQAQAASGTLLYPFNAQIEYLSEHLPQG